MRPILGLNYNWKTITFFIIQLHYNFRKYNFRKYNYIIYKIRSEVKCIHVPIFKGFYYSTCFIFNLALWLCACAFNQKKPLDPAPDTFRTHRTSRGTADTLSRFRQSAQNLRSHGIHSFLLICLGTLQVWILVLPSLLGEKVNNSIFPDSLVLLEAVLQNTA